MKSNLKHSQIADLQRGSNRMPGPRGGQTRSQWHRPRRKRAAGNDGSAEDAELRAFFEHALSLRRAPLTFNLDLPQAREALADNCWQAGDPLGEGSMAAANSELAAVLEVLMRNSYRGSCSVEQSTRIRFHLECILVDLQRAQSQKQMPLLTARMSCACLRAQLPREIWEVFSMCYPGLLTSHKWTEDFVSFASERRPPCAYEELALVGGVMFDNYTRKVLYSSKATIEKHGYLLNMTNWGSIRIPRMLAPAIFNAQEACEFSPPLHVPTV